MSNRRWLLGMCVALALPAAALAQFPGGGGPGGGGRGRGMFGDPAQFFNTLSKGKDVIVVDELDDRIKGMISRFGITPTNGQITREQFSKAMEQASAMMGGGMRGEVGAPATGAQPSSTASAARATPASAAVLNRFVLFMGRLSND